MSSTMYTHHPAMSSHAHGPRARALDYTVLLVVYGAVVIYVCMRLANYVMRKSPELGI